MIPIDTFVFLSSFISSKFKFPAFVCGNNPDSNAISDECIRYSAVDLNPFSLSQLRASGYLCSGCSPVTKSASTHLYFFANCNNSLICCFDIKDIFSSPGSALYVQYEHVSLHKLTMLKNAFFENVTVSFLFLNLNFCAAKKSSSVFFFEFS